jgi:3-methyladenine DNA glycosylase AlkD
VKLAFFERRFAEHADRARAAQQKAYMKSALEFTGVTQPELRRVCADFLREQRALDRAGLRAIAEAAYATRSWDLRSAALVVLEKRQKLLVAADAPWLIAIVRESACWAHVDLLATKVIGALVAREPKVAARLDDWARDDDFWVRRTALLAHLEELRHGGGDFDRFARLASPMVGEREFFIRKAIGWILREVSKERPELTFGFLRAHRERVAGLTLREGAKYLPKPQRAALGL